MPGALRQQLISWGLLAGLIASCSRSAPADPDKDASSAKPAKQSTKTPVSAPSSLAAAPWADAGQPGLRVRALEGDRGVGGEDGQPKFQRRSGIDFENRFDWNHPQKHLYPHGYAGGGVAVGDYDGDGRPDLFLTSQTGRDRLFRQVGGRLEFEDVTDEAGLADESDWGTGATFVDLDGDGHLDLYVCNYGAKNRFYRNLGNGRFSEAAAQFGLDVSGATIMAASADYDLDGDLDLYLVTNRLYPPTDADQPKLIYPGGKATLAPGQEESFIIQHRNIGGEVQKFIANVGQRDRLLRNEGNGRFVDASVEAGISGNHPGLAATFWDADGDGDADLYVSNDFWEPDRFYLNDGSGHFTESVGESFPHTPWFSMGADFGDIDGDGRLDFFAADMSATTHFMSKLMMGNMDDARWFLTSATPRQYMRNAVYLNTGTPRFMEVAWLTGLASTDWSWSPRFGDYDNDGRLDLFVSNGTANHSFDPDLTREQQAVEARLMQMRRPPEEINAAQWQLYRKREPRRERNVAMRNLGDLRFEPVAKAWGLDHESISFGAAAVDLDRDGDLDLVVSNVDDPVSVYENMGNRGSGMLVSLRGPAGNRHGLGVRVEARVGERTIVRELQSARGYMSSSDTALHFGVGAASSIDSVVVHWPRHGSHPAKTQTFRGLEPGHHYEIDHAGSGVPRAPSVRPETNFEERGADTGLHVATHREREFDDYQSQPLLPAKLSRMGPAMAWADFDDDGDADVVFSGSAGHPTRVLTNDGEGHFSVLDGPWQAHAAAEDTALAWLDIDADGDLDLYVARGGVEFPAGDERYRDHVYLNQGRSRGGWRFVARPLPGEPISSGTVAAGDVDGDGKFEVFVGGRSLPGRYPQTPPSRLWHWKGRRARDVSERWAPGLRHAGMITAAVFDDLDADGRSDLLLAREWAAIAWYRNVDGRLQDHSSEAGFDTHPGWWNGIAVFDLDGDGDRDLFAGNAGLNTKYGHGSTIYVGEFDGTGREHIVEAKISSEHSLPVRGLSCSSGAMPELGTRFPSYRSFARAELDDIYGERALAEAQRWQASQLRTGTWVAQPGTAGPRFEFRAAPRELQAAPSFGVVVGEFDGRAGPEIAVVHNDFDREPETGHWDGGIGAIIEVSGDGELRTRLAVETGFVVPGDATALARVDVDGNGAPDLVVARNDEAPLVFFNRVDPSKFLSIELRGRAGNPRALGARVTVTHASGRRQTATVDGPSGYLSQSSPVLWFGVAGDLVQAIEVRWPGGHVSKHVAAPGKSHVRLESDA